MDHRRSAWLGSLLLGAAACSGGAASPAPPASASPRLDAPHAVLPPRPEAVAEADALAVQASKASGDDAIRFTRRAAELRTRLWRLERREPDVLEALELYRGVEQHSGDLACLAQLDRAVLEGELRASPAETYAHAYRIKARAETPECRARAEAVLATLVAFRPLPNVLAEIDRQAGARDGGAADAGPSAAGSASVRVDAHGPVVVPALGASRPTGPVRITHVERYGGKDTARVVVFVTHPTLFEVGFIPAENVARGPRLYVDIEGAGYKGALEHKVGGLVERVRLGKRDKGTRVVLDLSAPVVRKVFYLPEPFRLVIDVATGALPGTPEPATGGPRAVRRVVLDPGHGGHDPGAVGPAGLREKDVTLDVAHRAAPILARELGVSTLLTRDSDDFIPLDERAARANAFQADLFVSIHCNASEDPSARGFMTFVLDDAKDALASSIAARENAASAAAAAELANAMSRVLEPSAVSRSVRLAEVLQKSTFASLATSYADEPDGGVKRAGFYVLAGARMPAVLFETSFISNPVGESRLNTGDYRQKLADAIVNAVRAYREGR